MLTKLTGDGQDVLQVGRAVFVGRCADSTEDDLHIVQHLGEVGGKLQTSVFDVALDKLFQAWFIDGHDAILEFLNLLGINIDTGDTGTHLGETGATDKADIACSYYCDIHFLRS